MPKANKEWRNSSEEAIRLVFKYNLLNSVARASNEEGKQTTKNHKEEKKAEEEEEAKVAVVTALSVCASINPTVPSPRVLRL